MEVRVYSSELSKMVRTVSGVLNQKTIGNPNIEMECGGDGFTLRAVSPTMAVTVTSGAVPTEEGRVVLDGKTFSGVVSRTDGEVHIRANSKECIIKSIGRTRLPAVDMVLPSDEPAAGMTVKVSADDLKSAYAKVGYAVCTEQTRPILTGVLAVCDGFKLRMVALDGFQLSLVEIPASGDECRIVIPGTALKLICDNAESGGDVALNTDGKRLTCETGAMRMTATLLQGNYVDYEKILPRTFATETLVNTEAMKAVLRGCEAVPSENRLVRMEVLDKTIHVSSIGTNADFAADVDSMVSGDGLSIAFNGRYLTNAMNAIGTDMADIVFNSAITPAVIREKDGDGAVHLLLPVRLTDSGT